MKPIQQHLAAAAEAESPGPEPHDTLPDFEFPANVSQDVRLRFHELTMTETLLLSQVRKCESYDALCRAERLLKLYLKNTKLRISNDPVKAPKDEKTKADKSGKSQDKVPKLRQSCCGLVAEAHAARAALLEHHTNPRLVSRLSELLKNLKAAQQQLL